MKELKITSTLPVWIDFRDAGVPCKIGFNIEHTGPDCSYGKDMHFDHGPEITFRILDEKSKEIYTGLPRNATPYIDFSDNEHAYLDTSPKMVVDSLLFDAIFWLNVSSVEQRNTVIALLSLIKIKLATRWPENLLEPKPSGTLEWLIDNSTVSVGTAFHVHESREGASSIWLKRVLRKHRLPGNEVKFTIESRWTHVRNIMNVHGDKKEVKESCVYETAFDEMPKTEADFIADIAKVAHLAANFGKSTPAQ